MALHPCCNSTDFNPRPSGEISEPVFNSATGNFECTVQLLNAGTMVLEAVVNDDTGHWNPSKASVHLEHATVPLNARTYAMRDGIEITEADYGTLNDVIYGIEYEESALVNGDTLETFMGCDASYGVVPLSENTAASSTPYTIYFKHNTCEMEINGEIKNAFFCRNYAVLEETGSLKVNPVALQIKAKDTTVSLKDKEPGYEYELVNVSEDYNIDVLFEKAPSVVLDTSKTDGKSFEQLSEGVYKDALVPQDAVITRDPNYYIDPDKSYLPGNLTVEKIKTSAEISVLSKIYDEKTVETEINITEGYDGTPTVEYYKMVTTNDTQTETLLPSAPAEAGRYKAVLTVPETTKYKSTGAACEFSIFRAVPHVEVPVLDNIVIEPDLKLNAQSLPAGWEWVNPDLALSVGPVSEVATYTPTDETNYFKIRRSIKFEVLRADSKLAVTAQNKIYDGTPTEVTVDTVDWFDGKNKLTYTYYAVATDESGAEKKIPLNTVPVDAGSYCVVVSHGQTDNFEQNTADAYFEISKAASDPEIPQIPNLYMKQGLKLKDQSLPTGWEWKTPELALSVGTVKETAVYTPEDTRNYLQSEEDIKFEVLRADSGLTVTAKSKAYDGEPAEITVDTVDWFDGKDKISYTYYAIAATRSRAEQKTKLDSAPVDAGSYCVVVSHGQTDNFEQNTADAYFEISKAASDPEIPQVPNLYIKQGLKLKDQALPAGWEWKTPELTLSVGPVKEAAVYTPEDTKNYLQSEEEIEFEVLRADSGLTVTARDKVYDGSPTEISVDTVDWFDGKDEITYTYYALTTDESLAEQKTKLDAAPADAGTYRVVVSHGQTENFEQNTADADFEISKAASDPEIPQVPDLYMKQGLKLKDQALPTGWEWKTPELALSVGAVKEAAVYTPEDAKNYLQSEGEIEFEVLRADSELTVTAKSKAYDGKPAEITVDTVDWFDGKDNISYTYYVVTTDKSGVEQQILLNDAPVNIGRYRIVVSHEQTENFEQNTAEASFEITKKTIKPQNPNRPDTKNSGSRSSNISASYKTKANSKAPKTGDYTNITLYVILMIMALAGLTITVSLLKARKRK